MNKPYPLFLIKPKSMAEADIKRAERRCGIVIIECDEPDAARFLEKPLSAPLDEQAAAALELMRHVMDNPSGSFDKSYLVKWFCRVLMNSPRPKPVPPVKGKAK